MVALLSVGIAAGASSACCAWDLWASRDEKGVFAAFSVVLRRDRNLLVEWARIDVNTLGVAH